MRICNRCVLPETFPGIEFDPQGVCNFCRESRGKEFLDKKKRECRETFENLVSEHRDREPYGALMSFSGGKDSTYTLALLKKRFGLKILAVTVDNGFVADRTIGNIRAVVETLGVDHLLFKPRFDLLRKAFRYCAEQNPYARKTLERASAICTTCMGLVKFIVLRLALEKSIPIICYGWSPGQAPIASSIMKNNPQMIRNAQSAYLKPLLDIAGDEVRCYFLEEKHFRDDQEFPTNVHPLAFLDYDEEEILRTIGGMGWVSPRQTDPNSTNCLLNSFANLCHLEQFEFHPYAFELAGLVREGYMLRETALQKLESCGDRETIEFVRKRLEGPESDHAREI